MYSAYKLNKQGDNTQPWCTPFPMWNQSVVPCPLLLILDVHTDFSRGRSWDTRWVWYSHLFKNFPEFVVIHAVEGFGIVNKAEIDVFLELSCFFDDLPDVGSLISGSFAFSKSSLNIWQFTVHVLLKPGLENFEHYFTSVWNECNCAVVWAFFGIAFLWDWDENWPFPVLWPLLSFPICRHIECSTFTVSSFRIWNSSTGDPSPPLALFRVMLPKAHLTLHSRMSGSTWLITPSWLSGLWRSFLYSSSMYSYHLFLISSSVRVISFLSFIEPIFAWNVPLVCIIFLKRSLVFPILLFSFISLHWSLRKAFLSLLAILWNSAFKWVYLSFSPLFFSQLSVRPPQTAILLFCTFFFFLRVVVIPVSCKMSQTSVHSSSVTLSDLFPWIYFYFHCIIIRDLI